jgi:hypothetical protein
MWFDLNLKNAKVACEVRAPVQPLRQVEIDPVLQG